MVLECRGHVQQSCIRDVVLALNNVWVSPETVLELALERGRPPLQVNVKLNKMYIHRCHCLYGFYLNVTVLVLVLIFSGLHLDGNGRLPLWPKVISCGQDENRR